MRKSVAQYANAQGISPQRARELARTGKIAAERNGRTWVITQDIEERRPSHRPLSPASFADMLTVIADMNLDSVTGVRKQRAAQRLHQLREADHPAALLKQWAGRDPARPERPHQRAILDAVLRDLDDYLQAVLREIEGGDFSDPKVLRKRLRDAMQVRGTTREQLAAQADVPTEDVAELYARGRLRNFGRTARILQAAGLRPGVVPR